VLEELKIPLVLLQQSPETVQLNVLLALTLNEISQEIGARNHSASGMSTVSKFSQANEKLDGYMHLSSPSMQIFVSKTSQELSKMTAHLETDGLIGLKVNHTRTTCGNMAIRSRYASPFSLAPSC
jgi:hypothetical protein